MIVPGPEENVTELSIKPLLELNSTVLSSVGSMVPTMSVMSVVDISFSSSMPSPSSSISTVLATPSPSVSRVIVTVSVPSLPSKSVWRTSIVAPSSNGVVGVKL